ncbi:MAG: apolipoprotein N-acyltransferase [Candidatus Omnitrophota bacterium]|nr:apolipoprotein N-acyltransferase [Candidatus Omnitrophota bacterium]
MKKSFQLSAFRFQIILPATSAVLLILSFPNFNLEFLAWIGLVPLLFAIENKRPVQAFFISYLTGVLFFLGTIYWLIHVTLPGMALVVLYLALYFGVFGLALSFCKLPAAGYRPLFFIPALWVSLELLRSHLLGGFGWALLAHSQSYALQIIQISDITGAYGVSFLVAIVNAAAFLAIRNFKKEDRPFPYLALVFFLVLCSLAYGILRVNNIFTGEALRVAVIQGNIPQAKKWDAGFREQIMNKYESLTMRAAEEGVDLIIWPETSVPGYLESERDLFDRMKSLSIAAKTPILAGAPTEDRNPDVYYNSAILFADDGRVIDRYDKIHLVPFGEYVPLRKVFSFVENFAASPIGDFTAGKTHKVFKFFIERNFKDKNSSWRLLKKVNLSCLICFEDIFPGLTREFVKRGAVFLVNITNDAWFGRSGAAYQHAQSSVFRAVENRVNVVRAANTGLSCFIDQKGKITGAVESKGENLFVDGFKIQEIVLTKTGTFYTRYGDAFAYLCVFVTLVIGFWTKRN